MMGLPFGVLWRILAPDQPAPRTELEFVEGCRYRFDYAWPDEQVAVEVDGGQWMPYGGRHARDKDRDKHNLATAEGWLVFHFSPQQLVDDPGACVRLVIRALERARTSIRAPAPVEEKPDTA